MGTTPCPDDPEGAKNWDYNDNYAQVLIVNNIASTEMVHIGQCKTAQAMWDSFEAVHNSKGHQTIISTPQPTTIQTSPSISTNSNSTGSKLTL
jgi:hypothetical protein